MPTVDSLDIQISAQATKASAALDGLVTRLDKLSSSLGKVNGSVIIGLANGVNRLANAMQGMKNVKTSDFTRLTSNITKLGTLDTKAINNAASALIRVTKSFGALNGISVSDGAKQISELAKGISSFGYKSATQAIQNIPKLASAMKELITTLSGLPKVSQNLIDMTNALGNLARTGASSGRAATSLSKSLNTYTASTGKASKGSFSLASAIGKLYATYWLLFRAFGTLGKAIDISSDLTEVQNVVDVTFGEYSSLIEKMSQTSITDFGMSELTVKQVASRFQAMGTAMGFTQGKMADMSVELTQLTADMASFYNVEQSDVAEDLSSIFTGQTRPLRQYGLDLTEATLKEWAMKQGIDANMKSMTQAEKTMLRYQYVLANTGAAQGDFARTAGTWANQVRILKQNFEQLGGIVGGTLINALKPLVTALNFVMGKLNAFAKVVSDSLGKIFGWQYQASGSGGVTSDFESIAGSSEDLSNGTGAAADNLGTAADNAKKLKNHLLSIDELNVISQDSDSGSGSSGSSGSSGGDTSGVGGQWTKTESIWENYESELDTLYKLGEYIGTTLTNVLNNINWNNVYQGAKNFGSGLAEFLNGLISPELFGAVGKTIASSLNTVIYAALSFGETFDFYEFGQSIATGINNFFDTFDFAALADTLNTWVDGIKRAIKGFLDTITWDSILQGGKDFLGTLELDTVAVLIGGFVLKNTNLVSLLGSAIKKKLLEGLTLSNLKLFITSFAVPGTPAFDVLGSQILEKISSAIDRLLPEWVVDLLSSIGGGIALGAVAGSWFSGAGTVAGAIIGAIVGAFDGIKIDGSSIWEHISDAIFNFDTTKEFFKTSGTFFSDVERAINEQDWASLGKDIILGILSGITGVYSFLFEPFSDLGDSIEKILEETKKKVHRKWGPFELKIGVKIEDFKKKVSKEWDKVVKYWEDKDVLEEVRTAYEDFKKKVSEEWDKVVEYWKNKKLLEKVKTTYENFKTKVKEKWDETVEYWKSKKLLEEVKTTYENFKTKVKEKWDETVEYWKNKDVLEEVKTTYESFKDKLSEKWKEAVSWWKTNAKLPDLKINFSIAINSLKGAINTVIGWINKYIIDNLNKISIKIPKIEIAGKTLFGGETFGFDVNHIAAFENGGFPERADLFLANEHGIPELIGTMGGRTAVASGMEITGIADAVYSTGQTEASLLITAVNLLQEIAAKETIVNVGDKDVARSNIRGKRSLGLQLIKEV